jgi:hypothetical protein
MTDPRHLQKSTVHSHNQLCCGCEWSWRGFMETVEGLVPPHRLTMKPWLYTLNLTKKVKNGLTNDHSRCIYKRLVLLRMYIQMCFPTLQNSQIEGRERCWSTYRSLDVLRTTVSWQMILPIKTLPEVRIIPRLPNHHVRFFFMVRSLQTNQMMGILGQVGEQVWLVNISQ